MLNVDTNAANIAIVQNCYGLFFRGDMPGLLAQCAPDIVWTSVGSREDYPILGEWKGRDGVGAFFNTLIATHDFTEFTPKSFSADADEVFVRGHYGLTVKKTGRHAECDWVMVFTLRDGLIQRFREHTDTAALAAAWRVGNGAEAANLVLVQQIYADFAAGNIEAILAKTDPEIDWISGGSREDFPTLGARQGTAGAASFFKDVAEHNNFTSFEPRQMVAMGEMVVTLGHYGITAKATGKHLESDWAHAFTLRGDKCVKFQEFTDTAAFLKAGRP